VLDLYSAFILGVVEGITEFLPVSSTAHLILTSELLQLKENNFLTSFNIIIQVAPIFSVVYIYWERIISSKQLWFKLAVSFFPTGVVGFLFHKQIEELFSTSSAIIFMILTGIIFILFEIFNKNIFTVKNELEISYKTAFLIGCFQSLALIPGISRSGSTILGGMVLGLNRETSIRFSFLLAIPTTLIASGYQIIKTEMMDFSNLEILIVGSITSFLFAIIAIKTFLKIVEKYRFIPFGIYLIVLGLLIQFKDL
jgi:undecaprenyl-diphosphatase